MFYIKAYRGHCQWQYYRRGQLPLFTMTASSLSDLGLTDSLRDSITPISTVYDTSPPVLLHPYSTLSQSKDMALPCYHSEAAQPRTALKKLVSAHFGGDQTYQVPEVVPDWAISRSEAGHPLSCKDELGVS